MDNYFFVITHVPTNKDVACVSAPPDTKPEGIRTAWMRSIGLTPQTADDFKVGAGPIIQWDELYKFLA